MGKYKKQIIKFFDNRLAVLFAFIVLLFGILVFKLFELQIVQGEEYLNDFEQKITRTLVVDAPRGNIYDRNGVPLAINETVYSVKIDPSISVSNINEVLVELIRLFEEYDQEYIDNLPITKTEPYQYTFDGNTAKEKQWKRDMGFVDSDGNPLNITATEAIEKLSSKSYFNLPENMDEHLKRNVIGLRQEIYLKRYSKYLPITIAIDAKPEVVVELEENGENYKSVYVDLDSKRVYPYGKYTSHILGYIGKISDSEITEFKKKGYDDYTLNDLVGKNNGIEQAFENELRGDNGLMQVSVNSLGKRVSTNYTEEPTPGDKIYLTIDVNLQKEIYDQLEKQLSDILIKKLNGFTNETITNKEAISSMISASTISVKDMFAQPEGTVSFKIKSKLLAKDNTLSVEQYEDRRKVMSTLIEMVDEDEVNTTDLVVVMAETGTIKISDDDMKRLKAYAIGTNAFLIQMMEEGQITPQMLNQQPSTGSVVVNDINTGAVIAAVSYPSYDNNEFVNEFNDDYFYKVNRDDPTQPLLNRAFVEAKAPGSTFKMITGIAGLENGVITPSTKILDEVIYKKAGQPYLKNWSPVSNGSITVAQALETSCNYFFCEIAYRLGNAKEGTTLDSIRKMNEYMYAFGLGERTGVEILEAADLQPSDIPIIASPEYKAYTMKLWNPDASASEMTWRDGDSIQTSIGQSVNQYSAATMNKYIMTLGNGGTRYQFHLLDQIYTSDGVFVKKFEPVIEEQLKFSEGTLEAIYDGMYRVTHGANGTTKSVFGTFPINVAGKSGTAQEVIGTNDKNHTSFASFAPLEAPEIAVYATIPNGDTKTYGAPAARISKKVYEYYYKIGDYAPIEQDAQVINDFIAD